MASLTRGFGQCGHLIISQCGGMPTGGGWAALDPTLDAQLLKEPVDAGR